MGKYEMFPEKKKTENDVLCEIEAFCTRDKAYFNSHVLNSICTEPLGIAKQAYMKAINTNLGDMRLFPGARSLEEELLHLLGSLLQNAEAAGSIVSGGTEANLLAMFVAKQRSAKVVNPEIIVPESIHFSVVKASMLLGVKLVTVELDQNFRAKPQQIEQSITEHTIAVFATAGTSETGAIDPIPEINEICMKHNLYLHVDAASGGFIIPFAREAGESKPSFDFSLEAVMSITVDPHKYGLAVIPAGFILFRNKELQNLIHFESFFTGTPNHKTFIGTRSAAGAASAYAVIKHLGRAGFVEITKHYFHLKRETLKMLEQKNIETLGEADLNILLIKSSHPEETMKKLERLGWYVSVSKRLKAIRIVLHCHNTAEELKEFTDILAQLEKCEK